MNSNENGRFHLVIRKNGGEWTIDLKGPTALLVSLLYAAVIGMGFYLVESNPNINGDLSPPILRPEYPMEVIPPPSVSNVPNQSRQ
jgi:hypothetical protein